MRGLLHRLWQLTRLDLKDHLLSPWFFVVLAGVVVYFLALGGSQQSAAEVRILAKDDVGTEASARFLGRLTEKGYSVSPTLGSYEATFWELRRRRAQISLRLRPDGDLDVAYLTTRTAGGVLSETTTAFEAEREQTAHDILATRAPMRVELRLEMKSVLQHVRKRDRVLLTNVIYALSSLTSIQIAIAWLMGLESLSRLRRKYGAWEIAAGKLLAGATASSVLGIVFASCLIVSGAELRSVAWLAVCLVATVVVGLLFGLFTALIPAFFSRDRTTLLLGGSLLTMLSLFYIALFSGALLPASYLPPSWRTVSDWLPFRQVGVVAELLVLEGLSPLSPDLNEPVLRLFAGTIPLLVGILLLVRRH